jgi:hypothetical protein
VPFGRRRSATAGEREWPLVARADGFNPGRLEALDDEGPRLRAALGVHLPALHVIGGQGLQVPEQLRRVDDRAAHVALLPRAGRRARKDAGRNNDDPGTSVSSIHLNHVDLDWRRSAHCMGRLSRSWHDRAQ